MPADESPTENQAWVHPYPSESFPTEPSERPLAQIGEPLSTSSTSWSIPSSSTREFTHASSDSEDTPSGSGFFSSSGNETHFRRNTSTDLIRQRAAEKEPSQPGTIKRMQFTFSVDQPTPASPDVAVSKPDLKPSAEFEGISTRRGRQATRAQVAIAPTRTPLLASRSAGVPALLLPSNPFASHHCSLTIFALLHRFPHNTSSRGLSILCPTIELPLDVLLSNVDLTEDHIVTGQHDVTPTSDSDVLIPETSQSGSSRSEPQSSRSDIDTTATMPPLSQIVKEVLPQNHCAD